VCAAQEGFLEEVVFKLNSEELITICWAEEQDVNVVGGRMRAGRVS